MELDDLEVGAEVFVYSSSSESWIRTTITAVHEKDNKVDTKSKKGRTLDQLRPGTDPSLNALLGHGTVAVETCSSGDVMLKSDATSQEEREALNFLTQVDSEVENLWKKHDLPHVALMLHVFQSHADDEKVVDFFASYDARKGNQTKELLDHMGRTRRR